MEARVPVPGDTPVDRARAFVAEFAALWSLTAPEEQLAIAAVSSARDPDVAGPPEDIVHFARLHRGIPVVGARLGVHLVGDVVVYAAGNTLPGTEEREPDLSLGRRAAEQAALVAFEQVDGTEVVGRPRLAWFDRRFAAPPLARPADPAATRLTWELRILGQLADARQQLYRVLVDATSGEVVASHALVETHDTIVYDMSTWIYGITSLSTGTCWYPDDVPRCEGGACPMDASAATHSLHALLIEAADWFRGEFGRDGANGRSGDSLALVPIGFWGSPNAAYAGHCDAFAFSESLAVRDVAAHEFTHSVIRHSAELEYFAESGALNESYADVFGALVEGAANGSTHGSQATKPLRTGHSPKPSCYPFLAEVALLFLAAARTAAQLCQFIARTTPGTPEAQEAELRYRRLIAQL